MQGGMCETCHYLTSVDYADCVIFKVARETQIRHIAASQFGCHWHMTPEEHEAMVRAREEKVEVRV